MITSKAPILTVCFIALSGCAVIDGNISGDWDCPVDAANQSTCQSIADADRQALSHREFTRTAEAIVLSQQNDPENFGKQHLNNRTTEFTAKVWVYPFVDAQDVYHEGGFVHVVLKPSNWQINPNHLFPQTEILQNTEILPQKSVSASEDE